MRSSWAEWTSFSGAGLGSRSRPTSQVLEPAIARMSGRDAGARVVQFPARPLARAPPQLPPPHQLLDPRPAHRDQRELGRHEVAVEQDQADQDQDAEDIEYHRFHGGTGSGGGLLDLAPAFERAGQG